MKRLLFFICTLLCANVLMAQTTFWIGDLQYEVTSTNPAEVKVNDANSSITTAIIPSTVNYEGTDYSVTSIGEEAFLICSSLTSVTIPNSVTSIGDFAFAYCWSLTSITCLAETAPSLGNRVFYSTETKGLIIPCGSNYSNYVSWLIYTDWIRFECIDIDVDLGNSLTYFPLTFAIISEGERTMKVIDCDVSATVVEIPAKVMYNGVLYDVTSIESSAFSRCSSLTSITIPNSVTSIGIYAFYYCSSLTSVTIPNSVTSIGNYAFYKCSSLTSVNIGNSVTYIGIGAFYDCSSLTSITIPNSVTSIGYGAFYNCSSLTSVTIGNSVTSIGDLAFWNCSSLTSVTIPNRVTSIGGAAFKYCSSLTSVTCLAETAPSLGSLVFSSTPSNKTLSYPCGSDYSSWESATTWASVECIDIYIYLGNSLTYFPLTFAIISEGERTMEVSDCDASATDVEIPARVMYNGELYDVTAIGSHAFAYCSSLTSVDIPNSVTSIGSSAFSGCSSLTSVNIPNSVTSIGAYAFYNCRSLTSVNIPNSVTSIGDYAFRECSSLTSVTIPNSVTSIGNFAFVYCDSLTSVTCLAETAPSLGNDVFYSTPSNKTLTVPFNASGYTSDWGNATWQKIYHKINEGEIKTLTNAFEITEDNKRGVINEGVLRITQSGQLINQTSTNVSGIFEVETPTLANDKWSFIGAPFNNYKLEAVKPGTKDISISLFDYTTGNWSNDFATIEDTVGAGEGFFAWSFAEEPTIFTTDGEMQDYTLNNSVVTVTKSLKTHTDGGNWLALSNPYTFKLDATEFIGDQDSIKGGVVYRFNGETWDAVDEGAINMTEGFFVNYETEGEHSVSFSKYHRYDGAKAKAEKEYITLNIKEGERVNKLRFAKNPKAKQGDDHFDANKLFSPMEITEPYFVTEGVALVKEEVKEFPYTANLNIRNYETKEITISIDNIPEGVNVYLIDNGYDIKMNGGVEYNTRITTGENADRFKVLFKKQHRLEQIKDNQITITNYNRHISVQSQHTDLTIEVYNQLGQKVYSTKDYNFTLDQVPAGSYMIKAFKARESETKKIVIE